MGTGKDIVVKGVEISGNQIRPEIDPPREVRVLREDNRNAKRGQPRGSRVRKQ